MATHHDLEVITTETPLVDKQPAGNYSAALPTVKGKSNYTVEYIVCGWNH